MMSQDPALSHSQRPGAQRVASNHDHNARVSSAPPEHDGQLIVDVNRDNFEEETIKIMKLLGKYTTVAVDIEFPGIVFGNSSEQFSYSNIKLNADRLKIIQVGLSFADDNGVPPPGTSSWQFNLHFDLRKDLYAKESIEMLQAAGINFENHATKGINRHDFAEWLCVSNLPFNEDIKWICFSGSFDFTYLLKLLSNEELPAKEDEFYKKLKLYFPTIYDVKYMIESFDGLKFCGLSRLAIELGVARVGQGHQAGSDCLLTIGVFFKVKEKYLRGHIDNYIHANVLAGLKGDSDTPKDYYNGQDAPSLFADYSAAFVQQNAAAFMNYPPVVLRQPNGAMGMYPFYPEFQMAGGKVAPGANGGFNMLYGGLYPMSEF